MSDVGDLSAVLERFENTDKWSAHDLADALRPPGRSEPGGDSQDPELIAERIAFTFVENYPTEGDPFGTFYGPVAVFPDENGNRVEIPSRSEVTDEMLALWNKRARAARHPLMRARSADLVWDFSRNLKKRSPNADLARIAIDAFVELVDRKLHEDAHEAFEKLGRALSLALSINDAARVESVRTALLRLEEAEGEDGKPGTWGFAFDLLVENRKVRLSAEEEQVVIQNLEDRLARLTSRTEAGVRPDGFAAEQAALRLARYYEGRGRRDDAERVVRAAGDAFCTMADGVAGLLAMAWLDQAHKLYQLKSMKADAEGVRLKMRERGPEALEAMRPIEVSVEIPREEWNMYFESLVAGSLDEALNRIAIAFTPDETALLSRTANRSTLDQLFTRVIFDHEGRPTAKIGSGEEDLDGRLIHDLSQDLDFMIPALRAAFAKLVETHAPSAEQLAVFCGQAPIFDEKHLPLVQAGIDAYLRGDWVASIHVLVPQIEKALRRLAELGGSSVYKPNRRGGLDSKILDDLLRDPAVASALGKRPLRYLQVLLADPRGKNYRNAVCHALLPSESFNSVIADRIVHALLLLGLLREPSPNQSDPPPSAPREGTSAMPDDAASRIKSLDDLAESLQLQVRCDDVGPVLIGPDEVRLSPEAQDLLHQLQQEYDADPSSFRRFVRRRA